MKTLRYAAMGGLLIALGCASTGTQSGPAAGATPEWVPRSAIYELFVRDFSPAGTFRGVTDNLGRIQETGANVIWLMPIHPVGVPAGGRRLRFTTNHDETAWDATPVELFGGPAGARAAFVAVALLPGVPLLYNGQEVESPQKLGLFVQEGIEWNQPDASRARAFYRRVIDVAPSLTGDLTAVETSAPDDVIAYARGDVTVFVNVRATPVQVTPRIDVTGKRDLLSGATQAGNTLTLPAHGSLILAR